MNIVQIGNKLRHLPISILKSEDIVTIIGKVNAVVPEEHQITANSTGDDLYKLFNSVDAETQTSLLQEIFNSRRESLILDTIFEEALKQNRKDDTAKNKWSSVQGSVVLIGAGMLIAIIWSFISQHGTKPAVPDAVVGNMITELMHAGIEMLISHFGGS